MAKPIFLVKLPMDLTKERIEFITKKLCEQLSDWHVLVFPVNTAESGVSFQAFSESTISDIEINDLKKIVLTIE